MADPRVSRTHVQWGNLMQAIVTVEGDMAEQVYATSIANLALKTLTGKVHEAHI